MKMTMPISVVIMIIITTIMSDPMAIIVKLIMIVRLDNGNSNSNNELTRVDYIRLRIPTSFSSYCLLIFIFSVMILV